MLAMEYSRAHSSTEAATLQVKGHAVSSVPLCATRHVLDGRRHMLTLIAWQPCSEAACQVESLDCCQRSSCQAWHVPPHWNAEHRQNDRKRTTRFDVLVVFSLLSYHVEDWDLDGTAFLACTSPFRCRTTNKGENINSSPVGARLEQTTHDSYRPSMVCVANARLRTISPMLVDRCRRAPELSHLLTALSWHGRWHNPHCDTSPAGGTF